MPLSPNIADWKAAGGRTFYWDPTNGSSANDGKSRGRAKDTFANAYALCATGVYDHVVWADVGKVGQTTSTVAITLNKDVTALFGPGFATAKIRPATGVAVTCNTVRNCVMRGFEIASVDNVALKVALAGHWFGDLLCSEGTIGVQTTGATQSFFERIRATGCTTGFNWNSGTKSTFIDCIAEQNTTGWLSGALGNYNRFIRCMGINNTNAWNVQGDYNVFIGCGSSKSWTVTGIGNQWFDGTRTHLGNPVAVDAVLART